MSELKTLIIIFSILAAPAASTITSLLLSDKYHLLNKEHYKCVEAKLVNDIPICNEYRKTIENE